MEKYEILHKLEVVKINIDLCNNVIKLYTDQWIQLNKEYVKLLDESVECIRNENKKM